MHQEYRRIVSGADTAVLFVHGISGTPNHFRQRIALEEMVSPGWSVYNLLLDGHGKGAEDFSRSSMEKWRSQVRRAFEDLAKNHDRVMIAAHSMGTLFALQLAIEARKVEGKRFDDVILLKSALNDLLNERMAVEPGAV